MSFPDSGFLSTLYASTITPGRRDVFFKICCLILSACSLSLTGLSSIIIVAISSLLLSPLLIIICSADAPPIMVEVVFIPSIFLTKFSTSKAISSF